MKLPQPRALFQASLVLAFFFRRLSFKSCPLSHLLTAKALPSDERMIAKDDGGLVMRDGAAATAVRFVNRDRRGRRCQPTVPKKRVTATAAWLAALLCVCSATNADARSRAGVPLGSPWPSSTSEVSASALPVLDLPDSVRDGDTIMLACGRTYSGTLDLAGRRQVSVKTVGDCGPAVITPARPVGGWRRDIDDPDVWIADLPVAPALLEMDGRYLPLAHHPNSPINWLRGTRLSSERLRAALPSSDLAGANLVWRAADWLIQERRVAAEIDGALLLAGGDDEGFGLLPQTEFYVEGKRWMMDTPGEWAWHAGQLSLRLPAGSSPARRVWAAPAADGIAANDAHDIRIEGVVVRAAGTGINGAGSQRMQVHEVRIIHCIEAAIIAGAGSRISRVQVDGTVRHGMRANDDAHDVTITDSVIAHAGMLGMPKRSRGAIVFEQSIGQQVRNNHIHDASYIGIRVFRHARVTGNLIERACQRLSDCGGIYTFARDRQPLDVVIAHNRVHALGGRQSFGIYLDDFANDVLVQHNELARNPSGMQLHNGFRNRIVGNRFSNSHREHMLFNETANFAAIEGNLVVDNHFSGAVSVPVFRLWSHHGGAHVARFADFERNVYAPWPNSVAEIAGHGLFAAAQWRQWSGDGKRRADRKDDAGTGAVRASGTRPAPSGIRQREQE